MASQQQQARPMFRFASMLRPAGAPPPPPAPAAAPQPMFRPPVAAPFRPPTAPAPPPPQTRDPSPPPRPPTAPVPAPAPPPPIAPAPPQPVAPPPVAPAPRSPLRAVVAPPPAQRDPVVQPRFTVGAPPPATIPSAPKSPATRTSAAIPVVQDSTRPFQLYQAPKPATSSRSPPPSPRNLEPAMKEPNQYSPKVKPVSPLKLPPAAQFKSGAEVEPRIPAEIDQKTVVVQERSERNKVSAQKFNATQRYSTSETDWTGKREAMMTKDKDNIHHKKRSDTEKPLGMSILTLAGGPQGLDMIVEANYTMDQDPHCNVDTDPGENKGAMMELSPARANKHGFNGNPRTLQKEWSDGEKSGKESEEEGKSTMGEKNNVNPKGTVESMPMTAFMNSNVQGVNNSILHNASCTHHDPGVHLVFSRKAGRYTKEAHRLKD